MKAKVLYLCTGNAARSQMAEAFTKQYAGEKLDVYSGGLKAEGIHPYTEQVMEEVGIDISDQYSKPLEKFLGEKHFGYIITVCQNAEDNCPTFPDISTRLFWDIEDPKAFAGTEEEKLAKFRETREEIKTRVKNWVTEVTD